MEDDTFYSGDESVIDPGSSSNARKRGGRPSRSTAAAALPPVIGIEFAKLLELCVDKLLVGSDSALRTHLVELKVLMFSIFGWGCWVMGRERE